MTIVADIEYANIVTEEEPVGDGNDGSYLVKPEVMESEAGKAHAPPAPSITTGGSITEFAAAYGLPAGYLVNDLGFELSICDNPWYSILGVEVDHMMSSKGDGSTTELPLMSKNEVSLHEDDLMEKDAPPYSSPLWVW